jgi:cytochrome c5
MRSVSVGLVVTLVTTTLLLGCSTQTQQKGGEEIFNTKCSNCHPDTSKFESYFGKDAESWKKGVQKMVNKNRVKLTEEELNTVANYLSNKYR